MQTAQAALRNFLQAFGQLQLEEMMNWWAEDGTAFFPIEHQRKRLNGKAAIRVAFGKVITGLRAEGTRHLDIVAEDLLEQESGEVSVITFHLRGDPLCRRTVILRHEASAWRIVHLHASNASLS